MSDDIRKLKLICTNRGQHDPWRQWVVTFQVPLVDIAANPDRVASVALAGQGEVLELDCRYCSRKPQLAAGLAGKVLADALTQFSQGRLTAIVDVSLLT